jgi:hypothetical protein
MIWFYQRGDQHLYYEVRLRDDGPGFELGLASPEGTLLTEQFANEDALARRFFELQAALVREGWGPVERRLVALPSSRNGAQAAAGAGVRAC